MKTPSTILVQLAFALALIPGLGLSLPGGVAAQTFTVLHNFAPSDEANPYAGLVLSGGKLYGTAEAYDSGSSSHFGTVFAVNVDGTGFTNLHSFSPISAPDYTNSDGVTPYAPLVLSGNTLYGTTVNGGVWENGTVFKVNTDGTDFTALHSFTGGTDGTDGASPFTPLILSDTNLYGTTFYGGSSGNGTIFKINTDGTGFTNLYSFPGASANAHSVDTNTDGFHPRAGLTLSGNTLYGTAQEGGASGNGTVYAVSTDGTGFTILHTFAAGPGIFPNITNSDGAIPRAGLALSGNRLYGTTQWGGDSGSGAVFAVNTDGTGFTNLHSFNSDSDGGNPRAGLVLSGNTLYGTAAFGGSSGQGTVFALNTNGTGFITLHNFSATAGSTPSTNSDGAHPTGKLILSGNILYGTALFGGTSGYGTIFSLSLPRPELTINSSGANIVLTWPASAAGFTLQSAPAINGAFADIPFATSPYTNPASGSQKFFRLISN